MNVSKKFLKHLEIVRLAQSELLASPGNFLGRLLTHGLRITTFGIVYSYVYASSEKTTINGLTALNVIWSLALVQIIYQCSRSTFRQLKDEITHGQIETKLNKPYSFIVFSFLDAIGQAPLKFIAFSIVTVTILDLFFGIPTITGLQLFGIFIFFVLGLVLHTLIQQLIALSAFWIENPDPIFWIASKLSWIVNGTFVPLAILPKTYRQIANYFPLSAPFFIGRIFEVTTFKILGQYTMVLIIWIAIFGFLVKYFHRKGIVRVSIHGG